MNCVVLDVAHVGCTHSGQLLTMFCGGGRVTCLSRASSIDFFLVEDMFVQSQDSPVMQGLGLKKFSADAETKLSPGRRGRL